MKKDLYYYNKVKQEKLAELQDYIQSCIDKINILDSVKRIHKKDWSDFQNFLKNFETPDKVYIWYEYSRITIYSYIDWKKREIMINKYTCDKDEIENYRKTSPDRIISELYCKDSVYYTPDEIMLQIEKSKNQIKENLKKYQSILWDFENTCETLLKKLDPLLDFLQELKSKNDSCYEFKEIAIETLKSFY